jgi:hypothetical protein
MSWARQLVYAVSRTDFQNHEQLKLKLARQGCIGMKRSEIRLKPDITLKTRFRAIENGQWPTVRTSNDAAGMY